MPPQRPFPAPDAGQKKFNSRLVARIFRKTLRNRWFFRVSFILWSDQQVVGIAHNGQRFALIARFWCKLWCKLARRRIVGPGCLGFDLLVVIGGTVERQRRQGMGAPCTSKSRGSVYTFIVRSMLECRMAAWATRGATPPLLRCVPNVCLRAHIIYCLQGSDSSIELTGARPRSFRGDSYRYVTTSEIMRPCTSVRRRLMPLCKNVSRS